MILRSRKIFWKSNSLFCAMKISSWCFSVLVTVVAFQVSLLDLFQVKYEENVLWGDHRTVSPSISSYGGCINVGDAVLFFIERSNPMGLSENTHEYEIFGRLLSYSTSDLSYQNIEQEIPHPVFKCEYCNAPSTCVWLHKQMNVSHPCGARHLMQKKKKLNICGQSPWYRLWNVWEVSLCKSLSCKSSKSLQPWAWLINQWSF